MSHLSLAQRAVRGKLNRIKALVPDRLKDAHASLNRFIDGLDQAKRNAPDMIARFFDDLWQKLEDILGGPRLENAMSGPTNATLIRKQTRADAPKLEMAGGNRSINKATKVASKQGLKVPGRVQSRINIKTGSVSEGTGWEHVLHEHFNPAKNKSQFTVSKNELRSILQSEKVVQTPVCRTLESSDGIRYVREVDLGRPIGLDKYSHNQPTSVMTVLTDEYGNLVTATPGVIN